MKKYLRAFIRADAETLFGRAMSAGFWAAGLRITLRVFIIIRTVILARLLSPDDFGLMAVATLSILLLERFTESGFEAALVHKDDDIRPYLNTAWTMSIMRGVLMGAILVVAAPFIAAFFGAPEATDIVRVLALAVVIRGLVNIGAVYFVKELRFDKYFWLQLSDKGTDVVVSIGVALIWPTVWALVFGVLAGAAMRTVVSYLIQSFRPRVRWEWERFKELFRFGKWILSQNVLGYITVNLDDIVVGRMLGISSLGLYRMAYNFSQAMATEITQVTSQVAFPTYSKLQGQRERLQLAYYGTLHLVAFIGAPLAIGTILVAEDFTIGVLGPQWAPMITALQLLSLAGLARGFGATTGPLFQSQGRPDIPPKLMGVNIVIKAALIVPAVAMWEIDGAAAVVVIAGAITSFAAMWVAIRFIGANEPQLVQAIGYPALNTAIMAVAVGAVSVLSGMDPSVLSFTILAVVGVATYGIAVVFTVKYASYTAPLKLLERVRRAAE